MDMPDARAIIRRHQERADLGAVNVENIAGDLGINVWQSDLSPGMSGKLFRDPRHGGPSGYSILVNRLDSAVRKRFTLAHEIAHFILHRAEFSDELVDDAHYRSGLSNQKEAEANKLAAEILMPREQIEQVRQSGIRSPESLAMRFGVSVQAMKIRLGIPL